MSLPSGLALALVSAFALNWGWLAQHGAAQELPPLSLRQPVRALRSLFAHRTWVVGFLAGLGGWALYVGALALAPLSLVQATSAGGIALLAALAHRRGHDAQWPAVGIAVAGLALLGASLAGGTAHGSHASSGAVVVWLLVSAAVAAAFVPLNLGLVAGTLYAAGDVATKAAVHRPLFVAAVLAAHGLAFGVLQLGFQRGSPLATAGTSTLLTNALPIAAGVWLFHEQLPGGALGALRVLAFACVVVAAALLVRRPGETEGEILASWDASSSFTARGTGRGASHEWSRSWSGWATRLRRRSCPARTSSSTSSTTHG